MTIRTQGAGRKRHIMDLEVKTLTADSQGSNDVNWERVESVRAGMTVIRGRVSDDQASHHLHMAYRPGIERDSHRFTMDDQARIFSILSVSNVDEGNREHEIVVRENQ